MLSLFVGGVIIFSIDGLNGFNEAIKAVYPKAEIQKCIVHQIRNSLKFVSFKDRKEIAKDLKSIYQADTEENALLESLKRKTKQKGLFPSKEAAFKILFTSTQEVMEKWKSNGIRNWSEIYPQLVIYFQDILVKYL